MADASVSGFSVIAASTVTGFTPSDLGVIRTQFERCFAVPAAVRISSGACGRLVIDTAAAALSGGASFLQNGFAAATYFGPLVASSDMDGATFNFQS